MYLPACGGLLLAALVLSAPDRRMLLLVLAVGASVFVPAPHETAEQFYVFCAAVEILVAMLAWRAASVAGILIANICVFLVLAHIMGYVTDGSNPFSPYRLIVKILEVSQLLVCVVLSPVMAPILRNRDATPT